jgi:1-deoxy-D-xylulose-5-phosphate reductoisomerase
MIQKKKIIILGSTGSIGKNLINIIRKDKKNFHIKLLSTHKNIKLIVKQAKEFNVKNLIISDYSSYLKIKKKFNKNEYKFYNNFRFLDQYLKKKEIFYSMIAITGFEGLEPCLKLIKFSKYIAIANKESIICGWNLINTELKKNNTKFLPIDSEHFSISELINNNSNEIEKIFITASGGPFLNYSKNKLSKVTINEALRHPNWKMGKKISVDSCSMMNKVFEVIEAKNIFNISYKKISILIHPKSYIHSLVKFNNGQIKFLAHEPDMKIPIHNSLYMNNYKYIKTKNINIDILNNLKFSQINHKDFPLIKILNKLPMFNSLYETILVTINDYFVTKFLEGEINYISMLDLIYEYSKLKAFNKFKNLPVKNLYDIKQARQFAFSKFRL